MKDVSGSQMPRDTEKQGYKFLLDSLRDQLLRRRTIEEVVPPAEETAAPGLAEVGFPEGKKYYRIGEVAELLGVETHALRYWEGEFSVIRPKKTRSGQRIYDRRDIQWLATVQHLLQVEKYSPQGVKQKIAGIKKAAKQPVPPARPPSVDRRSLEALASEMKSLMGFIRASSNPFHT